jgi:ribosomal protein L14
MASYGDYLKGAVKGIRFYPRVIWGRRYKPLRLGFVVRGLVVQTCAARAFTDGARVQFRTNALVLLKRRGVFRSSSLYGPCVRLLGKRKYEALFQATV